MKSGRKTALSIAGSDCSGGAGIQADLKTMLANGVYGMSVITALTAQNTVEVRGILEVPPEFLQQQLWAVFEDIRPDAVKIGMVPNAAQMHVIAGCLQQYEATGIVIDPLMISSSGTRLMQEDAVAVMERELFPLADVITPNLPEAEALAGEKIESAADMERVGARLGQKYGCAVLLKGGHKAGTADDYLWQKQDARWYCGERIDNPNSHGTGCTLSSAIASGLAKGETLADAVSDAKTYLTEALAAMLDLGHGSGPLDHGYDFCGKR